MSTQSTAFSPSSPAFPSFSPQYLPLSCCSAMKPYKDNPDLPSPLAADLDNEPIPLFVRDRFPADIDYDAIVMSCRLASRLLTTPGACKYFATMYAGEARHLGSNDNLGERVNFRFLDPSDRIVRLPLPCHETDPMNNSVETGKVLQNLAHMIRFQIADLDTGVGGETSPDSDTETWLSFIGEHELTSLRSAFPRCQPIIIRISSFTYNVAVDMKSKLLPGSTEMMRLYAQLNFAISLVHGVGHALEIANHGKRAEEAFYADNILAEAGFDLETAILGGSLEAVYFSSLVTPPVCADCHSMMQTQHLFLLAYPCCVIKDTYDLPGWPPLPSRVRSIAPMSKARQVPRRFVVELLTNDGWRRGCWHPQTPGPLQVPTIGDLAVMLGEDHQYHVLKPAIEVNDES